MARTIVFGYTALALPASFWITRAGRRPACSEPRAGSKSTYQISPRRAMERSVKKTLGLNADECLDVGLRDVTTDIVVGALQAAGRRALRPLGERVRNQSVQADAFTLRESSSSSIDAIGETNGHGIRERHYKPPPASWY